MKKWEKPRMLNLGLAMTKTVYGNGGGNGGGTKPGNQNHGCKYCHQCFQSTEEVRIHIQKDHEGLDPD
ncbi:hypothetical protein GMA36_07350, partial [Turicibacter sanguinis]|nr:hypothetical protein [Turicibacter sanguinis]